MSMLISIVRAGSAAALGGSMLAAASSAARAEDGYDLWLRYRPVEAAWQARYRPEATALVGAAPTPQLAAARVALQHSLDGLLAETIPAGDAVRDGAVVFGTPASSPLIARLHLPLQTLGQEGYLIRSV